MFDSQFRLSSDLLNNGTTSDETSSNGLWPQVTLDRLLEHHDLTPANPISINDTTNNDFWSSSAQFKEFFNNYHQQYQQQNQPIDISSLISSSPQQQQQFSVQSVDNHIFEPQQDSQPLFFNQYVSDNNQMSLRRDSIQNPQQHRSRQPTNFQRQQQQQYQAPPLLQIPSEDHYHQQQQTMAPPRFKQQQQQQHPAYVACLNHGINYNGVSGPPILLPPSF